MMEPLIRFCTAADGVRLAYATHGRGPAIVKVANWLTHVEYDWHSLLWRHWWEELGRGHLVVRYDTRGCGLSDRDPPALDLDAFVGDLEAVVDAAGLDRFALLGISQGGATAVAYTARHPERISHLILCGAYARGRMNRNLPPEQGAEADLLQDIVRVGWARPNAVFRRVFTNRFIPNATAEQMDWLDELMRISTSPEMAQHLRSAWGEVDVTGVLGQVRAPTLVAHARNELAVPFEEGRILAARIPNARLLPLDSRNHVLLASEPAWPIFVAELRAFLGTGPAAPTAVAIEALSRRELEVLELVAAGMSNVEIAADLYLSTRTVERHLSNIYDKLAISGKSARAAAAVSLSHLRQPRPGR